MKRLFYVFLSLFVFFTNQSYSQTPIDSLEFEGIGHDIECQDFEEIITFLKKVGKFNENLRSYDYNKIFIKLYDFFWLNKIKNKFDFCIEFYINNLLKIKINTKIKIKVFCSLK